MDAWQLRTQYGPLATAREDALLDAYVEAKDRVLAGGFESEIAWLDGLSLDGLTETDFLREAAWVILSAGFRESVVRRCFPGVARAFLGFASSLEIVERSEECLAAAARVFRQRRKLTAIVAVAGRVARDGFGSVKTGILAHGVEFLETFPYVGPVTRYHLAKNVGLDVVKPDRHLCRVANAAGYPSADALCRAIASLTGDRASVVDLVIWRFATVEPGYVEHFGSCASGE